MIIVEFIALGFWAILGIFFWIPLLFRVIAAFCGTIVFNMVVNNPEAIQKSRISLDLAISFYCKGYKTIQSTFEDVSQPINNSALVVENNTDRTSNDFSVFSFLGQLIWTVIFWGLTLYPLFGNSMFSIGK